MIDNLFICYVPGLDRRRIDPGDTPHVAGLLERYGEASLEPLPTTELVPSLVTGTYPHDHRVWQVQLKPDLKTTALDRVLDAVPDSLMKLWQCGRHVFDPGMDLVCLPRRRRRKFISYRFKYTRRVKQSQSTMAQFNGMPSIFKLLGDETRYYFDKSFDKAEARLDQLVDPSQRMMFYEFYAFDMFCHWQMDQPERVISQLQRTDRLIAELHRLCDERDVTFMLLVDHGQEPVRGHVDFLRALRETGVPRSEYETYSEIGVARLWFHTDRARKVITQKMHELEHVQVRTWEEMHQYNIRFEDASFGELYLYCDHGYTFYPHDFAQPLGSFYQSFKSPEMRGRRFNPRHRGNHGHLPDHPSEKGYVVLADDRWSVAHADADVIDFAPSVLRLLGETPPATMKGTPIYRAAAEADALPLRKAV